MWRVRPVSTRKRIGAVVIFNKVSGVSAGVFRLCFGRKHLVAAQHRGQLEAYLFRRQIFPIKETAHLVVHGRGNFAGHLSFPAGQRVVIDGFTKL